MVLAVSIFSISLVFASLINNIYELYVIWFIIGIGVNSQNGISYPLLVETMKKSTGFLGSVMQGLYFVGYLLDIAFSLIFHYWRFYFLADGLFSMLIGIPLSLIIVEADTFHPSGSKKIKFTEREILYTISLSVITVGAFMLSIPLLSVVPTLFIEEGIPSYYTIILALVGFLGFAFAGYLSDRFPKWVVAFLLSAMGLISGVFMYFVSENYRLFIVMLMAYISAGFFGFIGVWASQTYPSQIRATSTNIVFISGRLIGGFSPFLSTVIFPASLKDGLSIIIMISAAISSLGSLFYLYVSRKHDT